MIVVANFHKTPTNHLIFRTILSLSQAAFSNGFNIVDTVDIVEIVGIVDSAESVESVRYIIYCLSHGPMVGKSCRVAGQVSGVQTAWLLFTTPTSSTSITVCTVCAVCVLCLCVCVWRSLC